MKSFGIKINKQPKEVYGFHLKCLRISGFNQWANFREILSNLSLPALIRSLTSGLWDHLTAWETAFLFYWAKQAVSPAWFAPLKPVTFQICWFNYLTVSKEINDSGNYKSCEWRRNDTFSDALDKHASRLLLYFNNLLFLCIRVSTGNSHGSVGV